MGLKAAVQALKKAEPLKDKVQRCKDLLNDNDAWMCQRQLQKIYQQVLILDLEYALDRKVEQELWNLGFKNYIAMLQSQAKDRRNPKRGESQAMLTWCLEAASGFYLTLLQEICTAFDLDLPFRRKSYVYGRISPWKAVEKLSAPHKSSCFYACQYCLVHLGDIARYRNQNKQAELFYRHAVSLSPSSGQPYNQLALLEASRGDKLGTVFHYVRSVAVKHPFPVASSNLSKTLASCLSDNSFNVNGKTKLTSQEYIAVFLKLHGILFNLGDLSNATTYAKLLNDTLTALVATESFSSWRLVQMLAINLYALQHTAGIAGPEENPELLKTDQLSADEKISRNCILDLIAGSLSALLLPVYTIKNAIVNYFALPTIKLCLDWIQQRPTILEEAAFTSRLQIWPSLCVLLNGLQSCIADFDCNQYAKVPLPEDRDLQGFLPLEKSFETLRFTNTDLEDDPAMLNKLRATRIIQLGRQIAQYQVNGAALISLGVGDQNEERKFVSAFGDTGLSNELMKELEELSLNKEKHHNVVASSPAPSESASSKGSLEIESLIAEIGLEKRGGILKPQGSLERNRDSTSDTSLESNSLPPSARKPRQNVAMQAIMRRAETEQKQVTFKNLSPPVVVDETEKNKPAAITPTSIVVTSTASPPAKASTVKNIVISVSTTAGSQTSSVVTSAPIQPRQPPHAPNMTPLHVLAKPPPPAVIQQQQPQPQLQQKPEQQQLKQLDGHLNNVLPLPLPQQQQRENVVLPSPLVGQFSHAELKAPLMPDPTLNLGRYTQQQQPQQSPQLNQQPGAVPLNAACYPNPPFNVQNPQFNKNFIANPSASMQQYPAVIPTMPAGQFGNGQPPPPVSQGISFPVNVNVNQSRLMQQQQQQRGNFPALSQSNNLLTQGLNLTPPAQQQQSHMGMHPQQNLLANSNRPVVNGMSLQNPMGMPTTSGIYPANIPETTMSNTPPTNVLQLNFGGASFGQNNFAQKHMSPSPYGSGQQTLFNFPPQANSHQNNQLPPPQLAQMDQKQKPQQSANNYPMFHGYEAKDYNAWKDPQQPPQPPVNWWGSSSMATTGQLLQQQQQQLGKDHPPSNVANNMPNSYQNWANPSGQASQQRMNNVPLTPGNNYQMQGRMYGGRNNEARPFEMDQKQQQQQQQQSQATSNTYSLFSGNSWGMNGQLSSGAMSSASQQDQMKARLSQQSLWSGPGPSPLERLLEQQKSLREGGT